MEKLPEELLEQIVVNVGTLSQFGRRFYYRDFYNLSLVSHQCHRIVKPYLYQKIPIWFSDDTSGWNHVHLARTFCLQPQLKSHVTSVISSGFSASISEQASWILELSRLKVVEVDLQHAPMQSLLPLLRIPSVTRLHIKNLVIDTQSTDQVMLPWDVTNYSITTLKISIFDLKNLSRRRDCGELEMLGRALKSMQVLQLDHVGDSGQNEGPTIMTFRVLVNTFRQAFATTLREFTFKQDVGNPFLEHAMIDARSIIKSSQLTRLQVDTNCLLRSTLVLAGNLRSLLLGPLCFPTTARKIYLRHRILVERMSPLDQNMMHSEEAQCLSHLITLLVRLPKNSDLEEVTIAVFLTDWFEDVASRVVRKHARPSKRPIKFIFASVDDYCDRDDFRSWPTYYPVRDPRNDAYNPRLALHSQICWK
ncbi:hypothetical protein ACN47E_008180 [Coniothyrium glycines]